MKVLKQVFAALATVLMLFSVTVNKPFTYKQEEQEKHICRHPVSTDSILFTPEWMYPAL
jgi:hypothetical protein